MNNRNAEKSNSPRVSVVINTCDRGAYLGDTLDGLMRQTYDNFEVIVVNGPSVDDTEKVAKRYGVRYFTAPFNLSVSRNIGIKKAAGEIVAFIDDDAVPDVHWIADIVGAYDDPAVGAVGGRVYNGDGTGFQYSYGRIGVWGYPETRHSAPYDNNDPSGEWFNINIGTNASYRRAALVDVGGFDEEIEYYHDESDVCVRLVQAGYKVRQLENAYVHHKMAPSYRRKSSSRTVVWDAIVKNTIYFALLNTASRKSFIERLRRPYQGEKEKLSAPFMLAKSGDITYKRAILSYFSLWRAICRGYVRGFSGKRRLMQGYVYNPAGFRKYRKSELPKKQLNFLLVSQGYPPQQTDGIARYTHVLAKELLKLGHRVNIVTRAGEGMQKGVFLMDGAWVYRHDDRQFFEPTTGYARVDAQLAHARSVLNTSRQINKSHKVDCALVPLWDAEGVGLLMNKIAPTILTLMSPLKKVVETQWFNQNDPSYEVTYGLEKECVLLADGIMSISDNIKKTISELYDVDWSSIEKKVPVVTLPLGVSPAFISSDAEHAQKLSKAKGRVEVLYVGRPERRKGIDLLLKSIPDILSDRPDVRVRLVGGLEGNDENGISYYGAFRDKYHNAKWFGQVEFAGRLSDMDLAAAYKNCDIFVAPSRYESFGQIYIEAMAAGKPVVGARTGGVPEVIHEGENGFLIDNESSEQLTNAVLELINNPELRDSMGAKSLKIMREKFSAELLARDFLHFSTEVIGRAR